MWTVASFLRCVQTNGNLAKRPISSPLGNRKLGRPKSACSPQISLLSGLSVSHPQARTVGICSCLLKDTVLKNRSTFFSRKEAKRLRWLCCTNRFGDDRRLTA